MRCKGLDRNRNVPERDFRLDLWRHYKLSGAYPVPALKSISQRAPKGDLPTSTIQTHPPLSLLPTTPILRRPIPILHLDI